ncbi:MAG: enoyl-CoA hydratase/isomerase family protein [Candidatus Kapaibacterium sp.]
MNYFPEYDTIIIDREENVARITLNRPDVHNAFNNELIDELFDVFTRLKQAEDIRCIVLTGAGKSFCAGADLNWMKGVVNYTYRQNYDESLKLARLMHLIFTHRKPVIARVNGAAIGGGVGLMSVCDILIASETAKFGLSEVRLGLVPAAISPFVMSRIGQARARELFITGERIDARRAVEIGLINYAVPPSALDAAVDEKVGMIIRNGPRAVQTVKRMIYEVSQMKYSETLEYNAEIIANLRVSEEGQEGMNAFLEKRKPYWVKDE